MTLVDLDRTDSLQTEQGDIGSPEEEGEPPDSAPRLPSTVWFGPKGLDSTERELITFLGSHNGVAVLQWPRDAGRSPRLCELGIRSLWLVHGVADPPPMRSGLQECLPRTATLGQIHASVERLTRRRCGR
jgi:hypothetical protein